MDGAFPSGPGGPRRGFRGTAENAKTKLCTRWMNGDCRFGDRCNFAHGEEELRALPPRDDASGGRGAYGGPGRGGPGGGYGGGYGGGPGRGGYGGGRGGPGGYGGGRGRGYGGEYGGGGYGPGPYGPGGYGPGPYGGGGYGGPPGPGPYQDPGGYGPMGGAVGAARGNMGGPPPGMTEDMWAQQGYPESGPNSWVAYRTKDTGEYYYHNFITQHTQWEKPADWPGAPPHV